VKRVCLLLFLVCSVCGCTGNNVPEIPKASPEETAAIKSLTDGGSVVASDAGGHATSIDLRKTALSAEVLAKLASLQALQSANLADTTLDDALLTELVKAAPQLVSLDLRGCTLADAAMSDIGKLSGLKVLRLSGKNGKTTVADDGMKPLAALKSLKVLAVDNLWIGKPGIEQLVGLPELEELYLAETLVDDDTIALIAKFPKLKKLRLSRTSVGDAALAALKDCRTLEELDLSENSVITDAGMESLAAITTLKKLNLWRVQISDTGALALAPLTSLQWLNLDNTKLSDAGLPTLKGMTSLTFLHLGSTQITDAGAPALFHLKSLKDLKITRTALAAAEPALAELKKNLPKTAIQTEYEGQ
jgi:Leucine-rich repeat (LRR) protein